MQTRSAKKRASAPRVDHADTVKPGQPDIAGAEAWKGESGGVSFFRNTVQTLMIMVYSQLIIMIWWVIKKKGGSFGAYLTEDVGLNSNILSGDFSELNLNAFSDVFIVPGNVDPMAWKFIFTFFAVSATLMKLVPGGEHRGPITANGHVPVYTANGVQCFLIHCALFVKGPAIFEACGTPNAYTLSIVYDYLGDILNGLNWIALAVIAALYIKGHVAPTGPDNGSSGNLICDVYWGMELYPRVFTVDVKQFTNCRFGMVFWAIASISCAQASMDHHGGVLQPSMLASVVLQLIYILKFFWWETGYFNSIDIMEDRAGYYICWGCLVYLPTVYTSMTMFMVEQPGDMLKTTNDALILIAIGVLAVFINYDADRMRVDFRRAVKVDQITGKVTGEFEVWGKPAEYIVASYVTGDGKPRKSLLLLSGYWGISRHFHYIPELSAAFFWSCGAGFTHFMPFFYVIYLTILLLDRSVRDDKRCRDKYRGSWDKYCAKVPSKVFPGIF